MPFAIGGPHRQSYAAMGGDGIKVGDQVVGTQIPGVFTVLDLKGRLVEMESDRGLRMTVVLSSVRKLEGEPPAPKDN